MTYCLSIRVQDGLVALADGRVTSGSTIAAARKIVLLGEGENRFFMMTSGLRSVRDKALAYLRRRMAETPSGFTTMLAAADNFAAILREVAREDKSALEDSNLVFNLHTLIGGQLRDDPHHTVFLVYPQGNWIEIDERSSFLSVGATAYGKPILDRALTFQTDLSHALKLAYLSFDSTRFSSTDVGYPIDILTYEAATRTWREAQFQYEDLIEQRQWWNEHLTALAAQMPDAPLSRHLLPSTPKRLSVVAEPD
ncbi:peptidase [Fodinicurvata sp. EGI_FJ10296]|uniref:peptidase n=1 Tax=Fodinicurvata sp. EGI_FJ10296 TaxID=3231908 RepID=UPI003452F8A3